MNRVATFKQLDMDLHIHAGVFSLVSSFYVYMYVQCICILACILACILSCFLSSLHSSLLSSLIYSFVCFLACFLQSLSTSGLRLEHCILKSVVQLLVHNKFLTHHEASHSYNVSTIFAYCTYIPCENAM